MEKELENREVEDGLEKRAGEDGVSEDEGAWPAWTLETRLFEMGEVEEEPEELEEEGFGFCVDIWGHKGRSIKSNKPS